MTTAVASRPQLIRSRQRLSRSVLGLLAAAVIAVSLLLFAVTPLQGTADFVVFTGALYVVAQTALSGVLEGGRSARDRLATTLAWTAFLIALVPLVAVLGYTIARGSRRFDGAFFTHDLFNVDTGDPGGGALHAIIGTLEQVLMTTVLAVPLGVLVAVYLVEYGRGRLARGVGFVVDVLTGLPSIVAGLFLFALWIQVLHFGYSGFAGSLALVVLMLPVVVRGTEEMFRLVPDSLREASLALGVPRWRTILKVVIPTALPGTVTAVMLAVARVTGETAPLLLLVSVTDRVNGNPFSGHQEALPLYVYQNAAQPASTAVDRAWAGALTLIVIVLVLTLLARLITRRSQISR